MFLTLLLMVTYADSPLNMYDSMDTKEITVKGIVRLVGNEPFTNLVITDEKSQDWYLDNEYKNLFLPYQQKVIIVKGIVHIKKQVLANGKEIEPKLMLKNVLLIEELNY